MIQNEQIKNVITGALAMAEKWAPAQVETLKRLESELASDVFKVVFLGDFKAGKSTVINKLFLRQDLLPYDVLETTAVPTHIRNGNDGLQVWQKQSNGSDQLVHSQAQIQEHDIEKWVTASSEEGRAKIAQTYDRVILSMPCGLPEKMDIVDTPGLNTPNSAVYGGTMREARSADALVYVVRNKQLTTREVELIRSLAGYQATKVPLFVVLNADHSIAEGQLENLKEAIKAQLANNKIANVPCEVFSLGTLASSNVNWLDAIDEKENSGEPAQAEKERSGQWSKLEEALSGFLFSGEVAQGRKARLTRDLLPVLESLEVSIDQRLSIVGQNQENIQKAEEDFKRRKMEYDYVVEQLLFEISKAQGNCLKEIETSINQEWKEMESTWDQCSSPGQLLNSLDKGAENFSIHVQRASDQAIQSLQIEIKGLVMKYQTNFNDVFKMSKAEIGELKFGWMAKIPTWLVSTVDVIIVSVASPLPFLLDLPLRWIAGKIPAIKDYLPSNLVVNMVREVVKNKLKDAVKQMYSTTVKDFQRNFDEVNRKLKDELMNAGVFDDVRRNLEEARLEALSPQEANELKTATAQLLEWKKAL